MPENNGLPDFKKLFAIGGLPELGPGPRAGVLSEAALTKTLDDLLARVALSSASGDLIRALFLLWHDHFDAAHQISQSIENPDGSFVHGILHRREPDYSNASYWFRRVGSHVCFPAIASRATEFLATKNDTSLELMSKGKWDPYAFIHACEKTSGKPPADSTVAALRQIQAIESEVLLEHFLES